MNSNRRLVLTTPRLLMSTIMPSSLHQILIGPANQIKKNSLEILKRNANSIKMMLQNMLVARLMITKVATGQRSTFSMVSLVCSSPWTWFLQWLVPSYTNSVFSVAALAVSYAAYPPPPLWLLQFSDLTLGAPLQLLACILLSMSVVTLLLHRFIMEIPLQ